MSVGTGRLLAIGTANGSNKFYDLWKRGQDERFSDWESYTIRASSTRLLGIEFLMNARASMTAAEYAQEYECDFKANVLMGSVYGEVMDKFTMNNIKEEYGYDPSLPVYTSWDLGFSDYTCVWFFQVRGASDITFIDYYENCGQDLSFYAGELLKKPYNYIKAILPHDGGRRDLRGAPISEQLSKYGFRVEVLTNTAQMQGIDEARRLLKTAKFAKVACSEGLKHLKSFRFRIDSRTKVRLATTVHDEHSHGADAFRYAAMSSHIWTPHFSYDYYNAQKKIYNVFM